MGARPRTNIQPNGRAEGESETKDRFSAKEGSNRADQARPSTHMQLHGRAEGESETQDRFSAKEGASRSDQARPKTNMQTLDGRFGDGKARRTGSIAPKK